VHDVLGHPLLVGAQALAAAEGQVADGAPSRVASVGSRTWSQWLHLSAAR